MNIQIFVERFALELYILSSNSERNRIQMDSNFRLPNKPPKTTIISNYYHYHYSINLITFIHWINGKMKNELKSLIRTKNTSIGFNS